jgi:hypothetical protein
VPHALECETGDDLLSTLVDCLLETDFDDFMHDFMNCQELGDRSFELAIQAETFRVAAEDAVDPN